jgi:high-affinity nickel-transport protein
LLASPLFWGLALGIRHAADADHVATIASVVVGRTNLLGALRTAIFWGLGHTLTFFAVGLAIVLFGLQVPEELERAVDVMIGLSLLLLGAAQLRRSARPESSEHEQRPHAARPLALGCMHGLAGSAAVALLALAAIHSELHALLYLALFGLGTMLGMAAITLALAWSFRLSSSLRFMRRGLVVAAGVASVLCGVSLLGELFFAS